MTSEEKVKLFDLKCVHVSQYFNTDVAYQNKSELAKKRQEVNLSFQKSVIDSFGKNRGLEILKAARCAK